MLKLKGRAARLELSYQTTHHKSYFARLGLQDFPSLSGRLELRLVCPERVFYFGITTLDIRPVSTERLAVCKRSDSVLMCGKEEPLSRNGGANDRAKRGGAEFRLSLSCLRRPFALLRPSRSEGWLHAATYLKDEELPRYGSFPSFAQDSPSAMYNLEVFMYKKKKRVTIHMVDIASEETIEGFLNRGGKITTIPEAKKIRVNGVNHKYR